jgi:hypothetical protein
VPATLIALKVAAFGVFTVLPLVIVGVVGPLTNLHTEDVILPSESLPDAPTGLLELVGKVIYWSPPAFAVGGIFAQLFDAVPDFDAEGLVILIDVVTR